MWEGFESLEESRKREMVEEGETEMAQERDGDKDSGVDERGCKRKGKIGR